MLLGQFLDRAGTGVWAASSVLYFTFVVGMDGDRLGLLLGAAGVAGIAGSPLGGRLAQRFSVRALLVWCHALRLAAVLALLTLTDFWALLGVVALICAGDRAAKTLEMIFATEAAGERRATYQALARSVANAAYGAGAGVAAIGLAVGTTTAYHALILANGVSYVAAALLVLRTRTKAPHHGRPAGRPADPATGPGPAPAPWRDRGYLLFVLLDIPMTIDGAILDVGLPLWLVHHTDAPHALIPAFLVINTLMVVLLQLRVTARFTDASGALRALPRYGALTLLACALLAVSGTGGAWTASALLTLCTVLITLAELMRSVSSWELAVRLAPEHARPAYLGVAGMSQSIEKSVGPPVLTSGVMAAGPLGWIALGAGIAGLSLVQRRLCAARLRARAAAAPLSPAARATTPQAAG
ncbi:MFS transporter [Streptomyces sp. VRA16 Mangrove soil]|nr:MFS transporter [Streptomyces sp. VRA16 Mangrove soil]